MFQVIVSDSVLCETSDELIAGAVAQSYRGIGWKNVTVKEVPHA